MTLSQAIRQANENAESYKQKAAMCMRNDPMIADMQAEYYQKLAKEQEEIRDWLKELQILRWKSKIDAE